MTMTVSRREFLQAACAAGTAAGLAGAAAVPLLGLIAPPADYPVPDEALAMYSSKARFKVFGLGLKTMTPEGYDSVIDKIVPGAQALAKAGASAIVIFGTSLTFYKGVAFNQQLIDQVKKATGLPATSMSSAVVAGLHAVDGRRLAVATAYNDEVNRRLKVFLGESGFEVLALRGLGLEAIGDPAKVSRSDLQKFSAAVFESVPKADALLVSCGGLRTLEILAPLEQQCKVPVVSSTPHALWAGVRLLGVSGRVQGYGSLLAKA
jgi:arylmalonate decarboxylase